jgi:coenzyme F420 biosynthesis associated uncharacterized protein
MVDWSLARQVARFAARSDDVPDLGLDLAAFTRSIEPTVIEHAGLRPGGDLPAGEVVGRATWSDANLNSLASLIDPVGDRLEERLTRAGPFASALKLGAGVTLAAEVGLVTGYMSQRVLGQYELALLQPDLPPRLLFVASNLERAVAELDVDRESFFRWVAIHELTHALQFGAVIWLREHLGALLHSYLDTVEVRIERGSAGGLPSLPNPTEFVERFREGGLAALVQTGEQRAIVERMQAAMAMIEGHAEHVMDALAPALVPEHEGLREAMSRRRASRSAPERILQRLFGMDMKLRQYELGKSFCDAVVVQGGIETLNRAWASPESLPTLQEIELPASWIERTAPAPAASLS